MTRISGLATLTVAAFVLTTGLASALDPIGGLNETIAPSPQDSIQNAVQSSSNTDGINRAVLTDPEGGLNDAVLGAKVRGNTLVINGRELLLALACKTGGTDLLTLSNKGDAVPAGTKLRWEVKSLGERGIVRLERALGAGETVRIDIGTDVDTGTPCAARAI